jgi:plasmid stabilization system protein ParE
VTYTVKISPLAEADLLEITHYLTQQGGHALGGRFKLAALETFLLLNRFPDRNTEITFERSGKLRRIPISGFPNHLTFYIVEKSKSEILIVRVLHGAQDITGNL